MKANINGKEVGFSYGLYFIGKAQEETGKELYEIVNSLSKNALSLIPDLMYLSISIDAQLDGKKPAITKREFIEWMESEKDLAKDDGLASQFIQSFTETIKDNLPKDDVDGEIKKK